MEKNRENCYEIAKQIYQLDKEVYECVGSSDEYKRQAHFSTIDEKRVNCRQSS